MAQIDLVDDLLGKDALDDRPALLADQVEENRLPFRLKLFGPLAGSADDVGVERAGEASLSRGDDPQMDLILARPCEQLRAFRPDLHLCAEASNHGRKADRTNGAPGKSVSVRVDLAGRRVIKKK